jgi:uncharacterized protein YbjT (DUF2867 family)
VDIIEGDLLQADVVTRSLEGMDGAVISLSALNWKMIRKVRKIEHELVLTILEEAKKAGVNRMVYLSAYKIRMDVLNELGIPEFGRLRLETENKVQESGLNWTILGCAPMFELMFVFLRKGKMLVPGGGYNKVATISDEDVGQIAAQAVQREDLRGKRFKLTGPSTWTFPEVAELISKKLGAPVKHGRIPLLIVNILSILLLPINPFPRYLYKSLLLLNNFPESESSKVPEDHQLLIDTFDYQPRNLEMEIEKRIKNGKLKHLNT